MEIHQNQNVNHEDVPNDLPPLVRSLKASWERRTACFNFPGHKRGGSAPSTMTGLIGAKPFRHDVTELDSFYYPKGPLLEAQTMAAQLFGAKETWFLIGGTSCGVQAAIMATCSPGDTIILSRNVHVSATNGVILSGAVPKYLSPQYNRDWDIALGVTPLQVQSAIKESKLEGQKIGAIFITSPTYNGICNNLSDISNICHSENIPLIVDEAHGAHFKFHPEMPKTALDQGADISIQSTHKVLSSLCQSSMLHVAGEMIDCDRLHKCLQSLQSTSPSWLLLASLDAARHQLSTAKETIFDQAVKLASQAKIVISEIPGVSVLDLSACPDDFPAMDPLRLTIGVRQLGLTGFEASEILNNDHGIVPEYISINSVTLALGLGTTSEHVERLVLGLNHLSNTYFVLKLNCGNEKMICINGAAPYANPVIYMNPREAFFASKITIKFSECCGEVCGECIYPYPPGIPVLVPGEVITQKAISYLQQVKQYGGVILGVADPLLESIIVCKKRL